MTYFTQKQRNILTNFLRRDYGEIAEDAVQQAVIKMHIKGHTIRDLSKAPAWLRSVAKQELCNIIRAEARQQRVKDKIANTMSRSLDDSQSPESRLISKEISGIVQKSLAELPKSLRDLIEDFYFLELTARQIQVKRKICKSTLTYRLSTARKLLRISLKTLAV